MLRRMCGFTLWQRVDVSVLYDAGYLDVLLSVTPCMAIERRCPVEPHAVSLLPCTAQVMCLHAGAHVCLIVNLPSACPSSSELAARHTAALDAEIDMGQSAGANEKNEPPQWKHAVAELLELRRSAAMPPWQGDIDKAGKSARWEVRQAAARRQAVQQPLRSRVWSVEEEEGGGMPTCEPVAWVTAVDVPEVMTMYHRTWGGLLSTDFEPQRRSLMVLERPVQAA